MAQRKGKEISFAGTSVWANYRKKLEGNLGGVILAHFQKNGPTAILEAILEIIQEFFLASNLFPEMITKHICFRR